MLKYAKFSAKSRSAILYLSNCSNIGMSHLSWVQLKKRDRLLATASIKRYSLFICVTFKLTAVYQKQFHPLSQMPFLCLNDS